MKTCTFLIEITKEGTQLSLPRKMRYAELYLKEPTVIKPCMQPLAARLPELGQEKTRLLPLVQLRAQEQAFN